MSDVEQVARTALAEISPAGTVGGLIDRHVDDEGTTTLSFVSTLSGYPGWHWSVSLAQLPGEDPTVLEAELLPGDGALLAPEWVPWAERLEEYRAAQAAAAAERADGEDDAEGDQDDDLDDESETDDDSEDDDPDDDEHDLDEDFGDDPDDGIDFESDPAAVVGVGEQHDADADADESGPEPDEAAGRDEGAEQHE